MVHNTFFIYGKGPTDNPLPTQEFTVFLHDSQIVFSWNSKDISEIARTLGEPEIDLVPCG